MKLLLTFLLSNTLLLKTFGQGSIIQFAICDSGSFCIDCNEARAHLDKGISITDYFFERINGGMIKNLTGTLEVHVLVDTSGKACCRTIGNWSNASDDIIRDLHISEIVDNMPLWELKKNKKDKENNLVLLEIKFYNQTFSVDYEKVEVEVAPPWEK